LTAPNDDVATPLQCWAPSADGLREATDFATSLTTACGEQRMAKRPTAPRTEARDTAIAQPPAAAGRRPVSSTAIDTDREPGRGTEAPIAEPPSESPDEEEIRVRAYHRYLQRGGGHGSDFEDWLEAERELREGRSKK
jgi:hypothetical protein